VNSPKIKVEKWTVEQWTVEKCSRGIDLLPFFPYYNPTTPSREHTELSSLFDFYFWTVHFSTVHFSTFIFGLFTFRLFTFRLLFLDCSLFDFYFWTVHFSTVPFPDVVHLPQYMKVVGKTSSISQNLPSQCDDNLNVFRRRKHKTPTHKSGSIIMMGLDCTSI
jgi:hypothetical protein